MRVDEKAIVLDFLPHGKSSSFKPEPLAQVIGTEFFTLLEVATKPDVSLKTGQEVYIGKGERIEVEFVKCRISYKGLTSNSVAEIDRIIEGLVRQREKSFVDFFNSSVSITIRRHQLELLPGLGKKHMLEIITEREKTPFASFEDIEKRIHLMPGVVRTITKRIIEELQGGEEKYYLFAKPPPKKEESGFGRRRPFRDKKRF